MRSLLLVRHAATASTLRADFGFDEEIEHTDRAAGLRQHLPRADRVVAAPSKAARQTTEAMGFDPHVDDRLAECDFGSWAGRSLAEIDTTGVEAWIRDPHARPHGGESIASMAHRVESFLADVPDGRTIAVTHAGPVRAAVLRALDAPLDAFWRVDVTPLSITELHGRDDGWRLVRSNWTP